MAQRQTARSADPLLQAPPHNEEAEQSVLGAILLSNDAIDDVVELVEPDDFYASRHQAIFRVMRELRRDGHPIDAVTLTDALTTAGKLAEVGGAAYLAELAMRVPTAAHALRYAGIVRRQSLHRQFILTSRRLIEDAYGDPDDGEFLSYAELELGRVFAKRFQRALRPMPDVIDQTVLAITEGEHVQQGWPTGFQRLDDLMAGLRQRLHFVGARPSRGKTSLALQLMYRCAAAGGAALFVSMEMDRAELAQVLVGQVAQVDVSALRSRRPDMYESAQLAQAREQLNGMAYLVEYDPALTFEALGPLCRRARKMLGNRLDLVVVDYVQLMRYPEFADRRNREREAAEISHGLKKLTGLMGCAVVALSQLTRHDENEAPRMSWLKESGAYEADADAVMLLHPDPKDLSRVDLLLAKNRGGPTGVVKLSFDASTSSFRTRLEDL